MNDLVHAGAHPSAIGWLMKESWADRSIAPATLAVARALEPTVDWREGNAMSIPVSAIELFAACHQGLQFGVRLALGATVDVTIRDVIRTGLTLAGAGVAVGVVLAWGVTRLVSSLIWGVGAHDPLTFVTVPTVLLVSAAAASLVPALRILRLDPARILKV